jgi:hypothetical protein
MSAGNWDGSPDFAQGIPDIPTMGVVEIALCSPRPATSSKGLVHVELQGLRPIAVVDVEPQIVVEMLRVRSAADRSPVEFIGIRVLAGQSEFSGRTIQRWGLLMKRKGGNCHAQSRCTRRVHDHR